MLKVGQGFLDCQSLLHEAEVGSEGGLHDRPGGSGPRLKMVHHIFESPAVMQRDLVGSL